MDLQIIKTEKEYQELLDWVDLQFDLHPSPGSEEGRRLQATLSLISQYEDLH
jgi:HTH-type transcriptional regulator/antitoxin HigA